MPRYYSKSRSYRRRRGNYSKNSYTLAKKAFYLAKKAQVTKELKHNEITGTITAPTSSGSITELSATTQGDTNNTRNGDTIYPTSLALRMKMNINASADSTQVRVIIFRWISEAPSGVGNILESTSITSFKDQNERFQSQFLYDRVFNLNSVNKPELFFSKRIKLTKPISYSEAAPGVANRNGIWILIISDEAVNTPTLAYNTRLYFKDA